MTEASFLALESSLARHLPMVVPPRPWTNPHTGLLLLFVVMRVFLFMLVFYGCFIYFFFFSL